MLFDFCFFNEPGCIAGIKLSLRRTLVLYNFIEHKGSIPIAIAYRDTLCFLCNKKRSNISVGEDIHR
jgi:hypothetical protein